MLNVCPNTTEGNMCRPVQWAYVQCFNMQLGFMLPDVHMFVSTAGGFLEVTLGHACAGSWCASNVLCHDRPDEGMTHIYLKREDLNHTGAHKINNALGQALLCKRMGKKRIIAETGAGQHGVATVSTVASLFPHRDMRCQFGYCMSGCSDSDRMLCC